MLTLFFELVVHLADLICVSGCVVQFITASLLDIDKLTMSDLTVQLELTAKVLAGVLLIIVIKYYSETDFQLLDIRTSLPSNFSLFT